MCAPGCRGPDRQRGASCPRTPPFLPPGCAPRWTELGLFGPGQASIDAEEIFKPFARERIALHVEEEVTRHQARAASQSRGRASSGNNSKACLPLFRASSWSRAWADSLATVSAPMPSIFVAGKRRQLRKGVDAGRCQFHDLRAAKTCDEKRTIGLAPLILTAGLVVALRTRRARQRLGHARLSATKRSKPRISRLRM